MKHLFVCYTKYQLINAINIKVNVLKNEQADIILINYGGVYSESFERLKKSEVFENVYLHVSNIEGIENYIRNLREGKDGISLAKAIDNDFRKFFQKLYSKFKGLEYKINCKIIGNNPVDFSQYNHVWGYITIQTALDIVNAVKQNCKDKCIVSGIDEGVGSYTSDALKMYKDYDEICLYEPDAAAYKDVFQPINAIPKIDKNDRCFVELLNYVFDFSKNDTIDLSNKVIFFDQCYVPMPKYLKDITWWKKLLFSRNYKKHLIENVGYENQKQLFDELMQCYEASDVLVKLHPRTRQEWADNYKKYGVKFLPSSRSPWELFCLNCNIDNGLWVTINSSAVHTYDFTIQSNEKNRCFYGYCAYKKNDQRKGREYRFFLEWYKNRYDDIIVPLSIDNLKNWLKVNNLL